MIVPFLNIMNEWCAKEDTSNKIKAADARG